MRSAFSIASITFGFAALLAACGAPATPSPVIVTPPSVDTLQSAAQVPTSAPVRPTIKSMMVNDVEIIQEQDSFIIPGELNPGDELDIVLVIQDDNVGSVQLLGHDAEYVPSGDNVAEVQISSVVPANLISNEVPLQLNSSGNPVEFNLRIDPGQHWPPAILVDDPTGLIGEVSLQVKVIDINGDSTARLAGVVQEINFQDTGNKLISEYVSNQALSPFEIEHVGPGLYRVDFSAQWPGRFPLQITAIDNDGNETTQRLPIEIYWIESPFVIKGMAIGAYWDMNFDYEPILDQLVADNIEYVEINPIWFMPDRRSSEIRPMPESWQPGQAGVTMSDRSLRKLIQESNERNLGVFLKPMIEFDHFTGWRGDLQPASWNAWFDSYMDFIIRFATIAQEEGVPYFCVGAELKNSTVHTSKWQEIIAAVREAYSGVITYSDSELLPGNSTVRFWDRLDVIGAPIYYPSNGSFWYSDTSLVDPSIEQIAQSIERNVSNIIVPLVERYGLDVLITETGIPNHDGASIRPWFWEIDTQPSIDRQEQVDYYEAVMRVLSEKEWVKGLFWWETVLHPEHVGCERCAHFDPWGAPAENVLRIWYRDPAKIE